MHKNGRQPHLRAKYLINKEKHERLSSLRDFFLKSLIRSNPKMTSVEYKEPLEDANIPPVRIRVTPISTCPGIISTIRSTGS